MHLLEKFKAQLSNLVIYYKEINIKLRRVLNSIMICLGMVVIYSIPYLTEKLTGKKMQCNIKRMIGYDCPGCGVTRMTIAILHGDIYQAFRYNVFMFITIPFVAIYTIYQIVVYVNTGRLSDKAVNVFLVYSIVLLIFGVIRNIPIFSFLLPTVIN